MEQRARVECAFCAKTFYDASGRSKHLRKVHGTQKQLPHNPKLSCPLCYKEKVSFVSFRSLRDHFRQVHQIKTSERLLTFTNKSEFESWMNIDNKIGSYIKYHDSGSRIDYVCNRNNMKGYQRMCTQRQRQIKAGGSIKINGSCPSQIIVNFIKDKVKVYFCKTHVGHKIELRSQHLNKEDRLKIIDKLKSGVTAERLLKDSRVIKGDKLERINLLNRTDIRNLSIKANIHNVRHTDDVLAVAMKAEEWTKTGSNVAFLFKNIDNTKEDVGSVKTSEEPKYQDTLLEAMDEVIKEEQSVMEHVDNSAVLELKKNRVMAELNTLDSETQHAMLDEMKFE